MNKDETIDMLNRRKIKRVYFGQEEDSYCVGKGGVTEIKEALKGADFCFISYYEVYVNGELRYDVHKFSQVEYFESRAGEQK